MLNVKIKKNGLKVITFLLKFIKSVSLKFYLMLLNCHSISKVFSNKTFHHNALLI